MARRRSTILLPAAAVAVAGCNLDPLPLLQNYEDGEVQGPDVQDLDGRDDRPAVDGPAFVGALGPSDVGSGRYSGATFTFEGTGDRVCLLVDPQSVFRDDLQSSPMGDVVNPWMDDYPYDDGDVDLLAGLAAFYTGTPGVRVGDFFGSFPDDNGVDRAIDLNLCLQRDYSGQSLGSAGRATPEWCSFDTEIGTTYMGLLQVFSVPVDDDVLLYVLEVRSGECPGQVDECTIRGDYDSPPEGVDLPEGWHDVESMHCDAY